MPVTNPQLSAGLSNIGNTAGDTANLAYQRLILAGGNGITLSGSSSGGSMTVTVSGGGGGANYSAGLSNIGNTAGDTGLASQRFVLAGGNNITLSGSTNGGSMTITVSAPNLGAGAMSAGASNLGNTAGNTGITGTQFVFVGSGAMSLSQTTGANGGTLSILGPATSSLSATGQVSLSTNGSTISIGVPNEVTYQFYHPRYEAESITQTHGQGSWTFRPLYAAPNFQFDRAIMPVNLSNSSNSTGSMTISAWIGLYTKNASTLSLAHSSSTTLGLSFSGTAGNWTLQSGMRNMTMGWTTTITAGDYWLGNAFRTTSANTNISFSIYVNTQIATTYAGILGVASATSAQRWLGAGLWTVSSSGVPNSVAFSEIQNTNTVGHRSPFVFFQSGTV